jgi:saposin
MMKAVILAVAALLFVACFADEAIKPPKPGKVPILSCNVCQNVVSKLESTKNANVTLAWLQTQLKTVCTKYNVNDWCTKNVLPKLPIVLMWIKRNGSPDQACQALKLCKNTTKAPVPPVVHEDSLKKNSTKKNPFHGTGINCAVCENVVLNLEKVITSNESSTKLASDLTAVCAKLGVSDWCNKNLKTKIASLLTKLKAKTDPALLCKTTKFCRNATRTKPPKPPIAVAQELAMAKRSSEGIVKCEICTAIIAEVQTLVGSNTTEAAITKALDKACSKIPFAKQICITVLVPFISQIVEGIIAKEDPTQICTKIKLCSSTVSALLTEDVDDGFVMGDDDEVEEVNFEDDVEMKREAEFDVKCGICDAVISYAKSTLGKDLSSPAVKKSLDQACGKIPFAKSVCSSVIEPFLTQIVEGIVAKQNPTAICQKIKLCK